MSLASNLAKYLGVKETQVVAMKDKRPKRKGIETAQYQLGLTLSSPKEFKRVQKKLLESMVVSKECKKISDNELQCVLKPNSPWKIFGQESGNYSIFYPGTYEGTKTYILSHSVTERLFFKPKIMRKDIVISHINAHAIDAIKGASIKKTKKNKKINN